ncbi:MAG: YdeI/OmpD-associated family protein [Flavitalea sp.]
MTNQDPIPVFHPKSTNAWRKWLEKNHSTQTAVWLVFKTKASNKKSVTWSEAVDAALCFGWIDSKKIKIDDETAHQFFTKRKPKSIWSKINKDKIKRLTEEGLMSEAGIKIVEEAKANGSWTLYDEVENLVIPKDLAKALKKTKGASAAFGQLSKTTKKIALYGLLVAKQPATRQKRIDEIISQVNSKLH